MTTSIDIPTQQMLRWPIIEAFKELQSSCRQKQLVERVGSRLELSEEVMLHPRGEGPSTELSYRIHWAKFTLKKVGFLVRLEHGLWALTKEGQRITGPEEIEEKIKKLSWSSEENETDGAVSDDPDDDGDEVKWKSELLEKVRSMKWEAFEKLAKQVLSQLGFDDIDVTPPKGDKGIDLHGVVRNKESGIISSRVYVQCKRYSERSAIQRNAIDEFKGALQSKGQTSVGIFITSSRYTRGAKEAAKAENANNLITLIDGEQLAEMMKKTGVGVKKVVTVDHEFFNEEDS